MSKSGLPLLLLGGAAVAYYATRKKPAVTSGKNQGESALSGTEGVIPWRVIATGQGTYIAQWKRPRETSWRDGAIFDTAQEAADAIVGAIQAGDIP